MHEPLVVSVFAGRRRLDALDESELDLLVRQARRADVLAKLCVYLRRTGQFEVLPEAVRWHFSAPLTLAERHGVLVTHEIGLIEEALSGLEVPVIVLKGAAYVLAGLPAAEGRLFTDIDIMVPKVELGAVDAKLTEFGWMDGKLDPYDQKYYRRWMHELPPKKHSERRTLLDVHHAILPETARIHPDSQKLFAAARRVDGQRNLYVLAPEDMILHSMVHLFHDGEFEHGLRDLLDIQDLLAHFAEDPQFWDRLLTRAVDLELVRPLYYALHFVQRLLAASIPAVVYTASEGRGAPSGPLRQFMLALFDRGLLPKHHSCRTPISGFVDWLLYVRSHYLRMPPRLLIPHLFHKAFITPWTEYQKQKRVANQPTVEDFLNKRAP